MKRFRTQIEISPAFVALLCAYYYFDPAHTFAPFLTGILLHEAAHLLLLRSFHVRIRRLRLSASGAILVTDLLPYGRELAVAAAGPAANFLLLLLTARWYPAFALVNLGLFAYNLLPFYPLDGGRILRSLLHMLLPEHVASALERGVAGSCLLLLTAFCCYLTCVHHYGLWPVAVCGLLLVRVGGTVLPERNRPADLVLKGRPVN